MRTVSHGSPAATRRRRRLTGAVKQALRRLSTEVSLLNHRVAARTRLRDGDLACLDLVLRHGPLSPSALARRAGLHPATTTGVLDRLERGGWVVRERDPTDRRAVLVRGTRDRLGELLGLYADMDRAIDTICGGYDEAQLEVIADFLHKTAEAGRDAAERLADGDG